VSESPSSSGTQDPAAANQHPQALAHTSFGEVVLSFLLTVTAREYRSAVAQDYPKPANQVVLPGCTTNTSECNSTLHTANSVAESISHGDQVMNTRTWKRSVSSLSGRNNVMPDSEVPRQYISDLSNMTKINTSVASKTDNDSHTVTGSTLMQFGLINRHAWKRHANRTHISGFATNTEHSARTKRHSAVVKDLDTGVISGNATPKNVSEFRTNKVEVSSNKFYFDKIWKNLVSQNRTFSTNKIQPQEKLLLHSADYGGADDSSVDDRSADDSSVGDKSADDSSFVVQKLVKRDTKDKKVDIVTTMTEVKALSEDDSSSDASETTKCPALEYIVYTWVLCLVALATALKLYYLVKTTLATVMVTVFTTLFLVASSTE
jgi:hypothetical protein